MSRTEQGRVKLGDGEFLELYRECDGNKTEMARRLGVSDTAVRKRLKRISAAEGKRRTSAAAIARVLPSAAPEPSAFAQGVAEGARDVEGGLHVLAMLLESNGIIQTVLGQIRSDIEKRNGKIRPFERDALLKISARQEQLAKTYIDIQAKFLNAKNTQIILSAILAEVAEEVPDIHERVVRRLSHHSVLAEFLGADAAASGSD